MHRFLAATLGILLALSGTAPARQEPQDDSSALIDRQLRDLWSSQGVKAAARASDEEFLRRLCIDLVGEIPTPDEIRAFRADDKDEKRARKIDELLRSRWFARSWAERLTNVFLGYPRQFDYFTDRKAFQRWLEEKLKNPEARMDEIARSLLTASSDNEASRATGFLSQFAEFDDKGGYALKIEQAAGRASTVFLGIRLQCAQCHDHPFDVWTQEDFAGMAAFFSKTSFGMKDNNGLVDHKEPLKYSFDGLKGRMRPRFIDGQAPADADWRSEFARLTVSHPRFGRAIVNRVWAWLFGKGIVDPLDDMNEARKPVAPDLLDALAADFAEHRFNLRHLVRSICNSRAYQRTSARAEEDDPKVEKLFGRARLRPMTPEQLFQSISRATGLRDAYQNDYDILDLLGGQNLTGESAKYYVVRRWFIDMLVRTSDEAVATSLSVYSANIQQVLYALNKDLPLFAGTKSDTGGRLQKLLEAKNDDEVLTELYLSTVSRRPTDRERTRCGEHLKKGARAKAFEEIYWALLNTDEFIFNH